MRKLFKLGDAKNIPRGAPGRLSTAYGSLASAIDQWNSAVRAEENAHKNLNERIARQNARNALERREQPLVNVLVCLGYMKHGDKLLRKTLLSLLKNNKDILSNLGLGQSSSRSAMVDAFLGCIGEVGPKLSKLAP